MHAEPSSSQYAAQRSGQPTSLAAESHAARRRIRCAMRCSRFPAARSAHGRPERPAVRSQAGHPRHAAASITRSSIVDSEAGRRRSVYRFLFRTLPDPMMDALDCPAGDQLTPVRNGSVTVQQALALWNSAFVARHGEHFAARLETTPDGRRNEQAAAAVQLRVSARPAPEEVRDLSVVRGEARPREPLPGAAEQRRVCSS